ncbi:hypothetical protein FB45DRAFT_951980 [Roridomyces roridus]|uniref:Uncharacterized protein n=1 Tax=Roridomyces roridus TaxID=1738132 RepID=A0AAD7B094_9AGAR|nr:hypothetical protein FB45DRAFT_951980 [Roridomyces roridus]
MQASWDVLHVHVMLLAPANGLHVLLGVQGRRSANLLVFLHTNPDADALSDGHVRGWREGGREFLSWNQGVGVSPSPGAGRARALFSIFSVIDLTGVCRMSNKCSK